MTPFIVLSQKAARVPDTAAEHLLNSNRLDALVAPVALYPDPLVAQVLMASTYPLEVVQADRWAKDHDEVRGDRLKGEIENQPWDDTVKSLVATPSLLAMMNTKLDWTQKLGDAVLAQQADVMDAIQRLRSKAYRTEKLVSTKEQKVTVKHSQNREVITIEPTDLQSMYVPYYDPAVVYGAWPYPESPPYYYYPEPRQIGSGSIATGLAFGMAYALGRWVSNGRYWGGKFNWLGGQININRGTQVIHWQHNPVHRRGVRYSNPRVQQKFGNNLRTENRAQPDFRGRTGERVLNPNGRTNVGENGAADRLKADDRVRGDPMSPAQQRASRPSHPLYQRATGNVHPVGPAHVPSQRGLASIPRRGVGYAGPKGGRQARGRGGLRDGRGGRRRSNVALDHNVVLLDRLDTDLVLYRSANNGRGKVYVGLLAQERLGNVMAQMVLRA